MSVEGRWSWCAAVGCGAAVLVNAINMTHYISLFIETKCAFLQVILH